MALCIDDDNQSNLKNLPALKKLQFTPHLLMELKNLQVRYKFLDMGGCKYLADWLSKLPDGSLPCINIIEAGLEIADFLPIEKEHLIESKLGKAVEKIRKSKIKSQTIIMKCQEIINKWKRQILNLDESYDAEGAHEEQYREFKKKKVREAEYFQRINKRQKYDDDEDDTKPQLLKQESLHAEGEGDDPKLKKEQSDGFFIPQKNNFDFTYRPTAKVVPKNNRVKSESTKGQFIKKMLQMKKTFTGQQRTTFSAVKHDLNPDKS